MMAKNHENLPEDLRTRWIGLDIFRLFAALAVVTNHYTGIFAGVPFYFFSVGIFFLLAGAGVALGQNSKFGLRYFLSKTVRLYPAYIFSVALFIITIALSEQREIPQDLSRTLVEHALFLIPSTSREQLSSINAGFWVLPIFIEFYLVVSIIGRRINPLYAFLIGIAFVITFKTLLVNIDDLVWLRYRLPSFLYAFALGMLAVDMKLNRPHWGFAISPQATAIIIVLILFSLGGLFVFIEEIHLEKIPGWKFYHELCIFLQFGLLLSILYWRFSFGIVARKWIKKLATLAWPVYLVHLLTPQWIPDSFPVSIALFSSIFLTLLLAAFIHRYVDMPALKLSRKIR